MTRGEYSTLGQDPDGLAWSNSPLTEDYNGQSGLLRGLLVPSLQELYTFRVRKKAKKVTLDPSHPAHSLFELLPSGRRYRALSTKTARHKTVFTHSRPYPTWTTHNTPQYCTSVNNSSNFHLYIHHAHSQFSLWSFIFSIHFYLFIILVIICVFLLP